MYKKIILIGEVNSINLGDRVICNLSQFLYKQNAGDIDVVVLDISYAHNFILGRILRKVRNIIPIHRLYNFYIRFFTYIKFLFELSNESLVIFVGGQMFMNYFIDSILGILSAARCKNAKVRFNSVGTSSQLSQQNIKKLRKALRKAKCEDLTVRDGLKFVKDEIFSKASFVPDIAISSYLYYGKKQNKSSFLGWGCIDVKYYNANNKGPKLSKNEYLLDSFNAIKKIIEEGYSVELFTNGSKADYDLAQQLKILLDGANLSVSLAPCPKTDFEFAGILQKYRFVIASRLHALILSYSFDIPFIGISWDNKIEEFLQCIGHPSRVVAINDMTHYNFINNLHELQVKGLNQDIRSKLIDSVLKQVKDSIVQ